MTMRHRLLLSPALLLCLAPVTIAAQDLPTPAPAPAPAPAPSSGVQGPPDGLITPPSPGQRPIPRFQPLPPPLPAPTPSPAPTPAPRPAPAPVGQQSPQARPLPRPAPVLAPAPAPSTAPAPVAPLPDFVPPPAGSDALPTETAPPATPPAPPPADTGNALPEWLPLAAIGGALALLGGGLLWWRRRSRPLALPAPEESIAASPPIKPRPQAPAPAPAPTPARAAPNSLGRRADIALSFEPLSAQSTLLNLRMRYAVIVTNSGTIDAATVAVRIGLFAGSGVNPAGIAQWIGLDGEAPHHGVASLAPGATHRFEGELAAPLEALNPITVDGRKLAIPLVAVDVRYGHGAGEAPIEGQSARAFVIGREPAAKNDAREPVQKDGAPPAAKLAPFRLDQGPTAFAPLGLRDTGIGKLA